MQIIIKENYDEMSKAVGDLIIDYVSKNREAKICLASGDTPKGLANYLVAMQTLEKTDLSGCTFIGLDEWIGLSPESDGSCKNFLYSYLFEPAGIADNKIILFDPNALDLKAECNRMDEKIASLGGIDIMVVGIGMNGHIGFNEPGTPFEQTAHVSVLDDITIKIGQKYFSEPTDVNRGITLGLAQLQQSKMPILIAAGSKKRDVVSRALKGDIGIDFPASIFQTLEHSRVYLDEEASAEV